MINSLISKIKRKKIKIGIIGLGYVGLPLATRFIDKKIDITENETDNDNIDYLKKGKSYIPNI